MVTTKKGAKSKATSKADSGESTAASVAAGTGTASSTSSAGAVSEKRPREAKSAKGGKREKAAGASGKGDKEKGGKRKLGLRGAAPWAARHAAKHAAEARARAAEPPLPGSARATIRSPSGAEDIKAKIGNLHNLLVQIKALRKNLGKGFYEIGFILRDVQSQRLYEAKGYGTFESFLEREIDLGKTVGLRLVRIVSVFLKEAALEYGMDRLMNALIALETPNEGGSGGKTDTGKIPPPPVSTPALPMRPPGR